MSLHAALLISKGFTSQTQAPSQRRFPTRSTFSTRVQEQTKLNWHHNEPGISVTHSSLRELQELSLTTRGVSQGQQMALLSPGPAGRTTKGTQPPLTEMTPVGPGAAAAPGHSAFPCGGTGRAEKQLGR